MPRLLKPAALACALLCAALPAQTFDTPLALRAGAQTSRRAATAHARPDAHAARAAFGSLPLTFEVNRGQAAPGVEYLARGAGYTLRLARAEALLDLKGGGGPGGAAARGGETRGATLRMSFPGADPASRPTGRGLSETKSNYLKGRDPAGWLTGVENYTSVVYERLYDGVDLVFYGNAGRLEYDFRVAAGAEASRVRVRFDGARRARLDADGALVLRTRAGEVRQPRPVAYQLRGDEKTLVACDYTLMKSGEVGFRLGAYDRARELVIDPVFVYSTYLNPTVSAEDVAIDAAGNAYVAGFDTTGDALVQKLNPAGTALVYSTHVGGSGNEIAEALAVDAGGNAYVTGRTASANFPTSSDAFDKTCGNNGTCNDLGTGALTDVFVFKLNAAGDALAYSTYLGGSGLEPIPGQVNWPMSPEPDIALDAGGNAYVTGSTTSQDFPTTPGAFSTTPGASFVTKLNPTGSALVYSTYFPGAVAQAVAVDAEGRAHITGMTTTSDGNPPTLPVVNAYQPTVGGQFTFDAFAAKLNPAGTALLFSTFLGGPAGTGDTPRGGDDYGNNLGVDSAGNVYVTGATRSGCFPASNPYAAPSNCPSGGGPKQFLVKFNPAGDTLLFSKKLTTLVSSDGALAVGDTGFSTVAWSCQRPATFLDVCVSRFSPTGQTIFETVFGGTADRPDWVTGVAADGDGHVYVTGQTASADYPVTPGVLQPTRPTPMSAFVSKLSTSAPEVRFAPGRANEAAANYDVSEGGGKVTLRVERTGELTRSVIVDYATSDGTARSASDYTAAAGQLFFGAFETSKTIDVFVTDDAYGPEGVETFSVTLSNPQPGVQVGANASATVHVSDNDQADGPNPVALPTFDAEFFVRQHYLDFLGREPDASGFQFWTGQLNACGADLQCREVRRINVSGAFFLSIEFQEAGFYAIRVQRVAFGRRSNVPASRMTFGEVVRAQRTIGEGVVVNTQGWEQRLDARKLFHASRVVNTAEFNLLYPQTNAGAYVDALYASAGVTPTPAERQEAIAAFSSANSVETGRAAALRAVADSASVRGAELNAAFVLLQYHGYLRRNPTDPPDADDTGYQFWLGKLNQFNGNYIAAEMVKAFISSDEYRRRFGP